MAHISAFRRRGAPAPPRLRFLYMVVLDMATEQVAPAAVASGRTTIRQRGIVGSAAALRRSDDARSRKTIGCSRTGAPARATAACTCAWCGLLWHTGSA